MEVDYIKEDFKKFLADGDNPTKKDEKLYFPISVDKTEDGTFVKRVNIGKARYIENSECFLNISYETKGGTDYIVISYYCEDDYYLNKEEMIEGLFFTFNKI